MTDFEALLVPAEKDERGHNEGESYTQTLHQHEPTPRLKAPATTASTNVRIALGTPTVCVTNVPLPGLYEGVRRPSVDEY